MTPSSMVRQAHHDNESKDVTLLILSRALYDSLHVLLPFSLVSVSTVISERAPTRTGGPQ